MNRLTAVFRSPWGWLRLVEEQQQLVAIQFVSHPAVENGQAANVPAATSTVLSATAEQLAAYFDGRLVDFELPLNPTGTPFQHRVWQATRAIPCGETRSYSQIAAEIESPSAIRAVGAANGANPIPIIIPCHRVIGKNGKLTGYAGGLPFKQGLLRLEQQVAPLQV